MIAFVPPTMSLMDGEQPFTISFHRRHLPHWYVAGKPYFITARLKGSLPQRVAHRLRQECEELSCKAEDQEGLLQMQRGHVFKLEGILDCATEGPLWLADPRVAQVVMTALDWIENVGQWRILASTIMPNHLHLLLCNPGQGQRLDRLLQRFKGYTARQCNLILGRTGQAFWAPECFDHWCRSSQSVHCNARYICLNPVKSKQTDNWRNWPWTRVHPEMAPD